jgi:hypothetical protein
MRNMFLFLLAAVTLFADQVVLTNGDTISGKVVKKDGANLTVHSEFLGNVTMPWTAVKSLRSDEDLTVVLPGGESVKGKVSTSDASFQVAGASGTTSTPLAEVSAVRNAAEQHAWERLQRPHIFDLWAGAFDIGLALAGGNARTNTFTTAFHAARITTHDKTTITFNQIRGTARLDGVNNLIASAIRGGWTYNRNINSRVFASTFNDYERDRFQDLSLRFVAGGGLGLIAIKSERTSLRVEGGLDYVHESFRQGVSHQAGEANFGDDLQVKLNGLTTVTQSFRMFPSLTDTGQYRANFDLGTVMTIKKWLGWHLTASDRYLNNPALGRQRNDILLSTGLRLSFAR